ncbi:MAG: hypothetical protein AB7G93_17860 [Bdellovibrionales bacterium]
MIFVSATFVAFFNPGRVHASPQPDIPAPPTQEEENPVWPKSPPDENLAIATPPPVTGTNSAPPQPRYYRYNQALTFRMGLASDFPKINFDETVIGFQYLFPKFLAPKLEAGADLLEEGRGHLHAGVRWIYFERSYFRPSLKFALDHLMESKEGLATFTSLDNYFLRGAGTLEYVVWNPFSLRLESELLINFDSTQWIATLGLSRGW